MLMLNSYIIIIQTVFILEFFSNEYKHACSYLIYKKSFTISVVIKLVYEIYI